MRVGLRTRYCPSGPSPPENPYLNHYIRVAGTIIEYEGTPEIIVSEPAQIEILNP